MKNYTAVGLFLIAASLSDAQAQNRAGAFATVPVPGQVPAPGVTTPQPTTPPGPGVPRPAGQAQPSQQQQQEQLRIVADPATNSLIIYGTAQEYQNVKNILKELDAIPRQVLLDVMVAEVTLSDNQSLGVDYEILARNSANIFGLKFPSAGAIRSLGELFPTASGTAGTFGGGVSGVFGGKDIRAIVHALQSDSRFRVLASPSILAADNRPARIQIGTEEPIATGTTTTQVGTAASSTSIQYRNTGRIVTIIPQVNSQGLVNLQILAEVSQRREKNVDVGSDTFPAFDLRQAETTAIVHDGESLVIGGMIADGKTRTRSGVPYLMDLPVVGRFFGTTTETAERTELIMLITPHVIRSRDESRLVTAEFKAGLEKVRAELERFAKDRAKLLPPPPLPPMPDPNQYYQYDQQSPQPAPTYPPVGPQTSLPLVIGNVTMLSNDPITRQMMPPMAVLQESNPVSLAQTQNPATQTYNQPGQSADAPLPAQPTYALLLTQAAPLGAAPVSDKPAERQKPADGRRIWTVQVAALGENGAAESMAQKLRRMGFNAYVRISKGETKTWHRVRVGSLESQKDAAEVRNSLSTKKDYKDAYIAIY